MKVITLPWISTMPGTTLRPTTRTGPWYSTLMAIAEDLDAARLRLDNFLLSSDSFLFRHSLICDHFDYVEQRDVSPDFALMGWH